MDVPGGAGVKRKGRIRYLPVHWTLRVTLVNVLPLWAWFVGLGAEGSAGFGATVAQMAWERKY